MSTLAFQSEGGAFAVVVVTLVFGALLWRLIWAILVTPRLNQVPSLSRRKEVPEKEAPVERADVRVLILNSQAEPEPEYQCIEVITPREALPSRSSTDTSPLPALPAGSQSIVRRRAR